jgi:ketosteroid isomerase-like protein
VNPEARGLGSSRACEPFNEERVRGDGLAYGARSPSTPSRAPRDTGRAMSEESRTPDLVERWRLSLDAFIGGDLDAAMSFYAPDAEWDGSDTGVGTFAGPAAIRSFLEDWVGAFEEYEHEHELLQDLGNGVVFEVLLMEGSPAGSQGRMQDRYALTVVWAAGLIVRVIVRREIEEARAAAERLAVERG